MAYLHTTSRDFGKSFKTFRLVSCFVLATFFLCGCGDRERSFLTVQGCLVDGNGVAMFVDEMRAIAIGENMRFVDGSDGTAQSLRELGYEPEERTDGTTTIYIGVLASDGMGVIAGNLGLPGHEVALGFGGGSDAQAARDFAERVLAQLEQHWRFEEVPAGSGAMPRGGCP